MEATSSILEKYIYLISIFNNAGNRGLTMEEIEMKWKAQFGSFQQRTFHRQREALPSIFPMEIKCSNESGKYRYFLAPKSDNVILNKVSASWTNSLLITKKLADNIELADRIRMSPEYGNLNTAKIADAICSCKKIRLTHTIDKSFKRHLNEDKYTFNIDEDKAGQPIFKPEELVDVVSEHIISPYFLVFETYWFVIGADELDSQCIFCLERLSDIEILEESFEHRKELTYELIRNHMDIFIPLNTVDKEYDDRLMYRMMVSHSKTGHILL